MYIYKETSILTICFFFFVGVVGFFKGGGVGGLDIKYLLYTNVNFLRNFYTPNYYLFVFVLLFCWEFFSFLRGRMEDWILSTGISCIQMYIH
jgi:hypothetical protein